MSVRRAATMAASAFLAMAVAPAQANDDCTRVDFLFNPFKMDQNPLRGACGGHGQCVSGVCVCEDGYSGRADFFDASGYSCQSNTLVNRCLWAVTLVVVTVYLLISLPRVRLRWQTFRNTQELKHSQGISYTIMQNRGLLAIIFAFGLCLPSVITMAIVRIALPDQKVGLDALPTVLFATAKVGFYMAVYFFQPALIASVLHGNKSTRWIVQANYRINLVVTGLGIVSGFTPLVCLGASDGTNAAALGSFFGTQFSTFLQVVVLGTQAAWTKSKVVSALNTSLSVSASRRTQEIKNRLVAVENENIVQTTSQGILFALLMLIPALMLAHSEFLAVSWCAYGILSKKIAYTAVSDSKYGSKSAGASTSQTGSGSKDSFKDVSSFKADTQLSTFTPSSPRVGGGVVDPRSSPMPAQTTIQRRFQDNVLSFHEELPDSDSQNSGRRVEPLDLEEASDGPGVDGEKDDGYV